MASQFTVCGGFYLSMIGLIKHTLQNKLTRELNTIHVTSAIVEKNRNEIFQKAKEQNVSHMLQLDSDMTFPPNYLDYLLQMSKEFPDAVVSGLAFMGNPPHFPICFKLDEEGVVRGNHHPISKFPEDAPFEVDILGGYGFLVPRVILDKLSDEPFNKIGKYQEDFSFSKRVKELGFRLVVDPRIQMGHIRPKAIGYEDFESTVLRLQKSRMPRTISESSPSKDGTEIKRQKSKG